MPLASGQRTIGELCKEKPQVIGLLRFKRMQSCECGCRFRDHGATAYKKGFNTRPCSKCVCINFIKTDDLFASQVRRDLSILGR